MKWTKERLKLFKYTTKTILIFEFVPKKKNTWKPINNYTHFLQIVYNLTNKLNKRTKITFIRDDIKQRSIYTFKIKKSFSIFLILSLAKQVTPTSFNKIYCDCMAICNLLTTATIKLRLLLQKSEIRNKKKRRRIYIKFSLHTRCITIIHKYIYTYIWQLS